MDDESADEWATNEIMRCGVSLLHVGQRTGSLLPKRTSFSNFSPHVGHRYS
jgi:hypothetical protein